MDCLKFCHALIPAVTLIAGVAHADLAAAPESPTATSWMHDCATVLGGTVDRRKDAVVKTGRVCDVHVKEAHHRSPSLAEIVDPPRELPNWHRVSVGFHGEYDALEHRVGERVACIAWMSKDHADQSHAEELVAL